MYKQDFKISDLKIEAALTLRKDCNSETRTEGGVLLLFLLIVLFPYFPVYS